MKTASLAVAMFASLALGLTAQAPKTDAPKQERAKPATETVWTIQISGIRG